MQRRQQRSTNASLGERCQKFPKGNKALDLTRVVLYAVDHPVGNYMYPRDYHLILSALGGLKPVTPENTDAIIFQIYRSMRRTDLASDKLMKKAGFSPALRPSRGAVKERTGVALDKPKIQIRLQLSQLAT
jgi:hypothetical protein